MDPEVRRTMNQLPKFLLTVTVTAFFGSSALGCGSLGAERAQVQSIAAARVAARALPCKVGDLAVDLDTEDDSTREWIAGCNFVAIRVKCSQGQCSQVVERTWREQVMHDENQL
jgi:hypothetical protein